MPSKKKIEGKNLYTYIACHTTLHSKQLYIRRFYSQTELPAPYSFVIERQMSCGKFLEMEKEKEGYLPLFETKAAKSRKLFQIYVASVFLSSCFICIYRVNYIPPQGVGRWAWMGMLLAELWFLLYWIVTLFNRWSPIYRYTFKDRLSQRYEKELPGVDIFVCTADPKKEPPIMVINTVLSVMAYNYPPEKLSVYLSDDGGSDLIFYALLEASCFSKLWLPFCNKFRVEPRSPAAYFDTTAAEPRDDPLLADEWSTIKKSYEEMKKRIETITKLGQISEDICKQHKAFREWDSVSSRRDHQTILQILINGKGPEAVDNEGHPMPTLVYLAREKRPQHHHNFKAGALNALIRISSRISNGSVILTVDCDMYSNNSDAIREALCFFMDEKQSHDIAYIQFPQNFINITKNDIYAGSLGIFNQVDFFGMDACGGPCYIGTGCFHRRETLCGKKYSKDSKKEWKRTESDKKGGQENADVLEEACKVLANCNYENNTEWGKEMGVKYGCPVEDVITGYSIQCRGWKSIYFNPKRKAFLGVAAPTLLETLVQSKRWAEGDFQIFFSSYCPFFYGYKRIPLKLQISYCLFMLWAPCCMATLYYITIPSLCLLQGISLFPEVLSNWVIPFAYVFIASCIANYLEGRFSCGGSFQGWLNAQRIWMFKCSTSYLFAFIDVVLKQLGFPKSAFAITAKVIEEDVSHRYEQEIMEFGATSPMFTIITTLAILNLFCLVGGLVMRTTMVLDSLALQIILCWLLVLINWPLYQGSFFRKDEGRMPFYITCQSITLAIAACSLALYY